MSIEIFKDMLNHVMLEVTNKNHSELVFKSDDGKTHRFFHYQGCCENVSIEDICGDLNDLLDSPMLIAEEIDNEDAPPCDAESFTWTFYRFGTAKGTVTVRWLGTSNGYYGEGVDYLQE